MLHYGFGKAFQSVVLVQSQVPTRDDAVVLVFTVKTVLPGVGCTAKQQTERHHTHNVCTYSTSLLDEDTGCADHGRQWRIKDIPDAV